MPVGGIERRTIALWAKTFGMDFVANAIEEPPGSSASGQIAIIGTICSELANRHVDLIEQQPNLCGSPTS